MTKTNNTGVKIREEDAAPTIKNPADLSKFQVRILAVLHHADEPPKGVDVRDALVNYYEKPVNRGRLYPNLNELAASGYIEKGQKDQRSNSYVLTEFGRDALEAEVDWLVRQVSNMDIDDE